MGYPGPLALTGRLGTLDRGANIKANHHVWLVYLIHIKSHSFRLGEAGQHCGYWQTELRTWSIE
jgi:hypothetical protein